MAGLKRLRKKYRRVEIKHGPKKDCIICKGKGENVFKRRNEICICLVLSHLVSDHMGEALRILRSFDESTADLAGYPCMDSEKAVEVLLKDLGSIINAVIKGLRRNRRKRT